MRLNRILMRGLLALPLLLMAGTATAQTTATAQSEDARFLTWLEGLRADALASGISQGTLDRSLVDVTPIPRIIELDRHQPESTVTFEKYQARIVNATRIRIGRAQLAKHRALLDEIGEKFGVQPRFVVALWGIETNFGQFTGGFPVVDALATLAYDGRRSKYFRGELLKALQILEEGHIEPAEMKGSWAGAMGQAQFMPSSFLNFAHDYNGDGAKDIWNTQEDVFASAANYLKGVGWRDDITWGRKVTLPANFDATLVSLDVVKPIGDWQSLGVRRADGSDLPGRNITASILRPGGADGQAFIIYDNYRAILRWNRSHYFAMAVGQLSDRIAGR
ncbi:MAG: lytic murein transglycosylase [Rhodospirillaceae bacterium]|jgi:membrane-bound lytic murein transglycosylase B|nr:lytic murein transglycosylase [Rhodospirillaceae bacterium]MBT3808394.1 lytic murein transglycosylase [Rhodospirillaceae bacterium]MBT4771396.1 lytic murein transglycosylase [Rhodospirillaceae bacterium]MBT5359094.1 lytic murein transglycosylase [Rhodospirillaceae bacterium]MBT5768964.1 lytic murein transglycosylase [Rhodospirillaceae bacterium]